MLLYARSEKGRARPVNQDSYIVEEIGIHGELSLLALADGMGGYLAGEVASAIAVTTLRQHMIERYAAGDLVSSLCTAMSDAFMRANAAVAESAQGEEHSGMGTTLTAAIVHGDRVCIGHVGDSRAYIYRSGSAQPLTDDHSVVGELIRKGDLTYEQAMRHPQRNVVTRAVGTSAQLRADVIELEISGDGALILCSDGVTSLLTAHDIASVLAQAPNGQAAADLIIDTAMERGGSDDATCVIMMFSQGTEGGVSA